MRRARSILVAGLLATSTAAHAQTGRPDAPVPDTPVVSEVTVTADPAGLLERRVTRSVTGLPQTLLETPRSATFASAATLDRYGVRTIDALTAVSPGAFTDSYYGVAGALALRGTLAETYFDGFKRIENRGTYATPLGAAERVEIVRGPPTPLYGPGKVGGFLNITPKTARDPERGFPDRPYGSVEAGGGAYGYGLLDAEFATPFRLGDRRGGAYLYAEGEIGPEYYRNIDPRHLLLQAAADLDLAPGWRASASTEFFHEEGQDQTIGWNRLTQDLVDHGTYITGRDTTLKDLDGNGRLTPNEIGAGGLLAGYFGFPPGADPRFTLDTGVGTTKLDRRTVFKSERDFSNTDTHTVLAGLTRSLAGGDQLSLQVFYDDLANSRFVSYGFPADYQARTVETRASWTAARDLGPVHLDTIAGGSFRWYDGRQRESFNGGNLALDRRDLSYGPTPTDILDDPFSTEPCGCGLTWETDVHSRYTDGGLFGQALAKWARFELQGGVRYDAYDLNSRDDGTVVFGVTPGQRYSVSDDGWSWNGSLAYAAPFGLRPYVTLARTQALELSQAGGVAPQLIASGAWLSTSYLSEAGVKWRLFDSRLTGSIDVYRQTRTQLGQGNSVAGVRGEGAELEARWLATRQWSLQFAGNLQRSTVRGPDNAFTVIPPTTAGVAPQDGYGGGYVVYALSQLVPGDYTDTEIPHYVASLHATWTGDRHDWGQLGVTGGATAIGHTQGVIPGAVRLPAYALFDLSGFYARGPWRLTANIDNLFDRMAFTPVADVYAEVAALPIQGRTWRLRIKRDF